MRRCWGSGGDRSTPRSAPGVKTESGAFLSVSGACLALAALFFLAPPENAFAESGTHAVGPVQLALFGSSDPCEHEHDALKDSDDFFGKDIIQAAILGGVAGAIGGLFGGGGRGAAGGAVAGAVAGGMLAYYNQRQQQANGNQLVLAQSIGSDARNYGTQMDKATAAFLALKQCRLNEAASIKADAASGRISRSEAQERLEKARRRFNEEIELAQHLGADMNQRQQEMQAASDQLVQSDPEARNLIGEGPPGSGPPPGGPPGGPGGPPPGGPPLASGTSVEVTHPGFVREGPATYTQKLVTLERGDMVTVTGPSQGDWVPVQLVDGRTGFVNNQAFRHGGGPPPSHPRPAAQPSPQVRQEELAKATPTSRATVETVEATRSNLKRRETYGKEVKTAQNDAQVAFNMN